MKKSLKSSKGQVNSLDLIFAIVIFMFVITLFEFNWLGVVSNSQPTEDELSLRTYHTANTLFESGGYPSNWTADTVQVIGICDERNVVNKDKLARLINLINTNYTRAKELLGVGPNELYLNVTDPSNNIVYVDGVQASAGLAPSSALASAHSSSSMQISSLIRSNNSIAIVFDQSGSMDDELPNGQTKIDAAKNATNNFLLHIVPGDEVAVTTFRNCGNSYTAQNFTTDMNRVRWAVLGLSASGYTPIENVTRHTASYISSHANNTNRVMIVLSDGEETCGGSPGAGATYAMSHGVNIIHTIGFVLAPGSAGEQQLKQMAQVGGGRYFSANNSQELSDAFAQAYQSSEKQVVVNIVLWR